MNLYIEVRGRPAAGKSTVALEIARLLEGHFGLAVEHRPQDSKHPPAAHQAARLAAIARKLKESGGKVFIQEINLSRHYHDAEDDQT